MDKEPMYITRGEFGKDISDFFNRVTYNQERFIIYRKLKDGDKLIAEIGPVKPKAENEHNGTCERLFK